MKRRTAMKYEYVELRISEGFLSNKTSKHRELIDEYAEKGYRYVGWFPKSTSNLLSGVVEVVDLIFEKPE